MSFETLVLVQVVCPDGLVLVQQLELELEAQVVLADEFSLLGEVVCLHFSTLRLSDVLPKLSHGLLLNELTALHCTFVSSSFEVQVHVVALGQFALGLVVSLGQVQERTVWVD